jgi:GrpB-like predicted nucleotidyltransferase (UPF0157 family)
MSYPVLICAYDPAWPQVFAEEAARLLAALPDLRQIDHIGSTAVPGLAAKPVIDMMAPVLRLPGFDLLPLMALGYQCRPTSMTNRLFLCRPAEGPRPAFNLHIVPAASFGTRSEQLLRDHLRRDPEAAEAYAALKARLAARFRDDVQAYTRAKTGLVQRLTEAARLAASLPQLQHQG